MIAQSKCVLLHNRNLFDAVPTGHSVRICEEHGDVKRVIELFQYDKDNWFICVDLNPTKADLFEGNFFWAGGGGGRSQFDVPLLFIFQEELI